MVTRSDGAMLSIILRTAEEDEHILAVVMAGSRANLSNPRDIFMDFDIEYVVDDVERYRGNLEWARRFGEPMIIQMPCHYDYDDVSALQYETYLMQFLDGTRIDLTVDTLEFFLKHSETEPKVVLYDPKNIIPELPYPDGSCYFIKAPKAKDFDLCCNEYWWLHPYFAKEIWRGNDVLAYKWLEENIRPMLIRMLGWSVGLRNDWKKSIGKYGKFLRGCLTAQEWDKLIKTYSYADHESAWAALDAMDGLFMEAAKKVGDALGYYQYDRESANVREYLRHVRFLPKDAERIYDQ